MQRSELQGQQNGQVQLLPEPQPELLVPAVQRGLLLAGVLPSAGARGVLRAVLPRVRQGRDGAEVEGGRRGPRRPPAQRRQAAVRVPRARAARAAAEEEPRAEPASQGRGGGRDEAGPSHSQTCSQGGGQGEQRGQCSR